MTRKTKTSNDLVDRFVEGAVAWREAMAKDDARTANRHHDRALVPTLRAASVSGPDVIQRVIDLVDHPDLGVAYWAACFALQHDPARAEETLRRLATDSSLYIGFGAEMTLREWKKGTLEPAAWEERT